MSASKANASRHRQQQRRPQQVGDHQQPLLVLLPVDPGADEQRGQVGQPHQRGEHRDLPGDRVQHQHGDQRERQLGDPVAELRDGVADEERPERRLAQQVGACGDLGHDGSSSRSSSTAPGST